MRCAMLCVFSLLAALPAVGAGDVAGLWPGLSALTIDDTPAGQVRVLYDPALAEVLNQPVPANPDGSKQINVMRTRLAPGSKERFLVLYDEGPSVDPSFRIYPESGGDGPPLFDEMALVLVLPGNGQVYTAGHTNTMFDKRRKFEFTGGTFKETAQPFYYVGTAGVLDAAVTLSAEPRPSARVASVPAGSKVDVLLNKDDWYLLRTPFGLTGWAQLPANQAPGSPVKGLFYAGD